MLASVMKTSPFAVVFWLTLLVVFGLGAFLFFAADQMPAPGLILMLISGTLLVRHWFKRRWRGWDDSSQDDRVDMIERAKDSYDYDVERRRRGEFDTDTHNNNNSGKFD